MTYETLSGADWTALAETAVQTGIDIYNAIEQVKAIQAASKNVTEQAKAQYYLSKLLAKAKEMEEAQVIASKQKSDVMTNNILIGGLALLAALSIWH